MCGIEKNEIEKITKIVEKLGGIREKEIFKNYDSITRGTTNSEHKVYNIYSATDEDGHKNGFSVDVVTGRICGW